jgi:hypothetical protein
MNIAPSTLADQVARARHQWPFIDQIGRAYGLPDGLLLAVGSRETNLTDEDGDGGHGHGVFQLDDRSHMIPNPYPVDQQARDAAEHLASDAARFGNWHAACNSYNSGQPNDAATTGHDYGSDCMARAAWIAANLPLPPEDDMAQADVDAINSHIDTIKTQLDQDLLSTIRGFLTDFWTNQFSPKLDQIKAELNLVRSELEAVKAKTGA